MNLPIDLTIQIKEGTSAVGQVCCRCDELIRSVPGRRQVFRGRWEGAAVIIKIFCGKWSARRHVLREWRSLRKLNSSGLSCPEGLFYGRGGDGRWICVSEAISNAADVCGIFESGPEENRKFAILCEVVREAARQHNSGVLQKDMHLGNFLYDGKRVYAIDTAQMRFFNKSIGIKRSLKQLGQLCTNLPAEKKDYAGKLAEVYFQCRGLQISKPLTEKLYQRIERARQANLKRTLKKTMRNSKRYYRFKNGELSGMFSRFFCPPAGASDFAGRLDRLMEEGQILKRGNTCFVSRAKWNGRDVVIKRYNHKGWGHSLRHTLKGSRARRVWLNGYRLRELDIGTPLPVCFIEKHRGLMLYCAYIVNEFVDGPRLHEFLKDQNRTQQERTNTIEQVKKLLDRLHKHRITHGDLKPSNIIVTKNGPVLLDLDSMRVHHLGLLYRRYRAKDLQRFDFA